MTNIDLTKIKTASDRCVLLLEDKCDEVSALLKAKYQINKAYTYNEIEYEWQIDSGSQSNISAANTVALMTILLPDSFIWEGKDREFMPVNNEPVIFLTALDFMEFAKAIQSHCRALWQSAVDHKIALRLLTDVTAINNYDITTGW